MVLLDVPFDPSQHEPASFDPLPAGWYAVTIVGTEMKPTKSGNGEYLQLDLKIDENQHPEHAGRRLFDRLNLHNPNQTAVVIAQAVLSAICKKAETTIELLTDTDQLLGVYIAANVTVRPASAEYGAANEVRGYDSVAARVGAGTQPEAPRQQPATEVKPAAGDRKQAPWKR